MTAEEYLSQARKIDVRIEYLSREIQNLKALSYSLHTIVPEREHVRTSPGDAGYAQVLVRLADMEKQMLAEVNLMISLKSQAREIVSQLRNPDLEAILLCFYLEGQNQVRIGEQLHMHRTAVSKKRKLALSLLIIPDNAIQIDKTFFSPPDSNDKND